MHLPITPSQTIGPFLAIGLPWPDGPFVVPEGTPGAITITGQITDGADQPLSDALVETWQADPDGRFDHAGDPRGAMRPATNGFRGFGRCATDGEGRYRIVTVRPGALPSADGGPVVGGPVVGGPVVGGPVVGGPVVGGPVVGGPVVGGPVVGGPVVGGPVVGGPVVGGPVVGGPVVGGPVVGGPVVGGPVVGGPVVGGPVVGGPVVGGPVVGGPVVGGPVVGGPVVGGPVVGGPVVGGPVVGGPVVGGPVVGGPVVGGPVVGGPVVGGPVVGGPVVGGPVVGGPVVGGPVVGGTEAPHINVSVFARGLLDRVVTRIYFPDETAANAADPVLATVPDPARRATLIATPERCGKPDEFRFDIHLQGPKETVFFDV